jgi:galactose-1-phosphate uridylyltransferase
VLLPRLTILAGLELGAAIFVNTLPPEEAAARLKAEGPL